MNKRILTWAILLLLGFGAVVGVVILVTNHKSSVAKNPATVVSKVDKDTGAVVNYYPNQNQEVNTQGFTLLNGEELANFLGPGQYPVVVDQIKAVIEAKTGQAASLAKIMPGSVNWDKSRDVLLAKVKQDSPALQFTAVIKLQGAGKATVTAE